MKTDVHFLPSLILEWKMYHTKCVEKSETHFMFNNFFFDNCVFDGIMWKKL
jgi:hypothetical protein